MNIENDIFKKGNINISKLIKYGFKKEFDYYKYEKIFYNGNFKIVIFVNNDLKITGKIIDLRIDEEYIAYRFKEQTGTFTTMIRDEYINILKSIYYNCFDRKYFYSDVANTITKMIYDKYSISPEFLWESSPDSGVFRNTFNNKWFGIIMNIDKSKLDKNKTGKVEVINLKLDDDVFKYLKVLGIYRAYHMNKKNWVSVTLDGTLKINEIMNLVEISYQNSLKK